MEDYESVALQAIRLNDKAREAAVDVRVAQAWTHDDLRRKLLDKVQDYQNLARGGNYLALNQAENIRANLIKYDQELLEAEARRAGALVLIQTHYEAHPEEYMQMAREVAAREGFTQFVDDAVASEVRLDS